MNTCFAYFKKIKKFNENVENHLSFKKINIVAIIIIILKLLNTNLHNFLILINHLAVVAHRLDS